MKVLLCGYHEGGYRALRTLFARGHDVLVATHPTPEPIPSVAGLCSSLSIPCVEGTHEAVLEAAREFAPDITFSVYYRTILSAELLALAPLGAFNFHPSLLPKHAGCFSGVWAIIEGDKTTGVACHRMIERIDAGEIVDTVTVPVEKTDTGLSLFYKLVDAALVLFDRVVRQAEIGPLHGRPQEGERSYHPRKVPCEGVIDPTWPREQIERFIRAIYFPPHPPAHVERNGTWHPVSSMAAYDRVMLCSEKATCSRMVRATGA